MSPLRRVLAILFACACALAAFAHEPFQSTLEVKRDEENLFVTVVLSADSARHLLPEDQRPAVLDKDSFAANREALHAAAPVVCTLLDASDTPLAAARLMVGLNHENELRYVFLFDLAARPARLRMDYLAGQPPAAFCELTDELARPVRRVALRRDAALYQFRSAQP